MSAQPPKTEEPPAPEIPAAPTVKRFNNGWTKELEVLFADWGDRASCYRWMHDRTGRVYHSSDQSLAFPVIVLSTIGGAANFAMDSISQDPVIKRYVSLGLGGLSILTGIISTIANRLAYASSAEAHRVAAVSWGKFNRLIVIEMSLHPDERMEAFAFMKMFRIELDRLIEQSPPIPESIIDKFIYEFKEFTDIKKPDITGDLEHTRVFSDSNSRLKKIAEDAAMTLAQKKGIMKQLVLDDLDGKVRKIIEDALHKRPSGIASNPFVSGSPPSGSPPSGSPPSGSPPSGSPPSGSPPSGSHTGSSSPVLETIVNIKMPTQYNVTTTLPNAVPHDDKA